MGGVSNKMGKKKIHKKVTISGIYQEEYLYYKVNLDNIIQIKYVILTMSSKYWTTPYRFKKNKSHPINSNKEILNVLRDTR